MNCKSLHLCCVSLGAADIVVKFCVCVAVGKPIFIVQLVSVMHQPRQKAGRKAEVYVPAKKD